MYLKKNHISSTLKFVHSTVYRHFHNGIQHTMLQNKQLQHSDIHVTSNVQLHNNYKIMNTSMCGVSVCLQKLQGTAGKFQVSTDC